MKTACSWRETEMKSGIEITRLTARYAASNGQTTGNTPAVLQDLSMKVSAGSIAVVVGPSGAGKSTLLNCIAGLQPIAGGYIALELDSRRGVIEHGAEVRLGARERRRIGVEFQQSNLWSHFTVRENLVHPQMKLAGLARREANEWAEHLLDVLELRDHASKDVGALSGGQRQRVAIARSLCLRPDVLLFDEITANQDPENIQRVFNLIRAYVQDSGCTALTVSHDMGFVQKVADTVHFLHGGIIRVEAPTDAFFNHQRDEVVSRFLQAF